MAKEFLAERGVPYQEVDVSRDRQAAMQMIRHTGQRGVPVIAVGDEYVVGFDRPRLEQLLAQARPSRPAFGVAVADASRRSPGDDGVGAYVGKVTPNSPAARAGLAPGDVITEINGRSIGTAAELDTALSGVRAGEAVQVTYRRDGALRRAQARL